MKLSEREVAILRVFVEGKSEVGRGLYAARVGSLAGFAESGRRDAGTTRTLDSMRRKGLVTGSYGPVFHLGGGFSTSATARRWQVTDEGRKALGEYAFGE